MDAPVLIGGRTLLRRRGLRQPHRRGRAGASARRLRPQLRAAGRGEEPLRPDQPLPPQPQHQAERLTAPRPAGPWKLGPRNGAHAALPWGVRRRMVNGIVAGLSPLPACSRRRATTEADRGPRTLYDALAPAGAKPVRRPPVVPAGAALGRRVV